jgi:hypothetical protein
MELNLQPHEVFGYALAFLSYVSLLWWIWREYRRLKKGN